MVVAEEVARGIKAAERDQRVEEIRPPEEHVRRVEPAERASGHDEGLIAAPHAWHQLLGDVPEPALMLLEAPSAVAPGVAPGLLVDGVGADEADVAAVYPVLHRADHALVLVFPEALVLGRDDKYGVPGVAEDLVLHVTPEVMAVFLPVLYVHYDSLSWTNRSNSTISS